MADRVKELQGEEAAAKAWRAAGMQGGAAAFFDSLTKENPDAVKEECEKAGLGFLLST